MVVAGALESVLSSSSSHYSYYWYEPDAPFAVLQRRIGFHDTVPVESVVTSKDSDSYVVRLTVSQLSLFPTHI